jgi:hypothetical protein
MSFPTPIFQAETLIFVQEVASGGILAAMGFLILLVMLLITCRLHPRAALMMPVALICSLLTVRSEILVVLLFAYLAIELSSVVDIREVCAAVFPVRLGLRETVSRTPYESDEEAPNLFPFFASFASRAPPAF